MNEEDYVSLAKHLENLDELIQSFCDTHGFIVKSNGLGRYPRRRINKYGEVNFYFDLQMDLSMDGSQYEKFFPEIPYSLGMGAWLDDGNERFYHNEWCFKNKPFKEVKVALRTLLDDNYLVMITWNRSWLMGKGKKSTLK
jgi:hypothetical protein